MKFRLYAILSAVQILGSLLLSKADSGFIQAGCVDPQIEGTGTGLVLSTTCPGANGVPILSQIELSLCVGFSATDQVGHNPSSGHLECFEDGNVAEVCFPCSNGAGTILTCTCEIPDAGNSFTTSLDINTCVGWDEVDGRLSCFGIDFGVPG
ncbi:hypothetical protein K439DRAFT_741022 [Ramaria rubella]|nr:hypothetical protein K439DRAFT_741022 [Ramaria rubella]